MRYTRNSVRDTEGAAGGLGVGTGSDLGLESLERDSLIANTSRALMVHSAIATGCAFSLLTPLPRHRTAEPGVCRLGD